MGSLQVPWLTNWIVSSLHNSIWNLCSRNCLKEGGPSGRIFWADWRTWKVPHGWHWLLRYHQPAHPCLFHFSQSASLCSFLNKEIASSSSSTNSIAASLSCALDTIVDWTPAPKHNAVNQLARSNMGQRSDGLDWSSTRWILLSLENSKSCENPSCRARLALLF